MANSVFTFDEVTARRIVAAVRVVEGWKNRQPRSGRDSGTYEALYSVPPVLFYHDNTTNQNVPPYGCLAVTDTTHLANQPHLPIYKVSQPTTTFARKYIINGESTITGGSFGYGQEAGSVLALFTSTPTPGDAYGPVPGSYALDKGYPQICVAGGISGVSTAAMWASDLGPVNHLLCKLMATISTGSTASANVLVTTACTTSSWHITVRDQFLGSGQSASSGLKAKAEFLNNQWVATQIQCT